MHLEHNLAYKIYSANPVAGIRRSRRSIFKSDPVKTPAGKLR